MIASQIIEMNGRKLISLAMVLLLLSGCAGIATMSADQREQFTKKVYSDSYENIFNATLRALKNDGYPIIFIDKQNGIINTGSKSINIFLMQQKINVSISKLSEEKTSVQLFLSVDNKENQDFSDYKNIFILIEKELTKG